MFAALLLVGGTNIGVVVGMIGSGGGFPHGVPHGVSTRWLWGHPTTVRGGGDEKDDESGGGSRYRLTSIGLPLGSMGTGEKVYCICFGKLAAAKEVSEEDEAGGGRWEERGRGRRSGRDPSSPNEVAFAAAVAEGACGEVHRSPSFFASSIMGVVVEVVLPEAEEDVHEDDDHPIDPNGSPSSPSPPPPPPLSAHGRDAPAGGAVQGAAEEAA